MKYSYYVITLVIGFTGLFLISCNVQGDDQSDIPERHELACVLDGDVWKIVSRDTQRNEIEVARRDTVVWYAPEDRDMFFQFMTADLTEEYTYEVPQGESLTLVIGDDAESREHRYAVFVYGAREYAQGESPPRMIIRD